MIFVFGSNEAGRHGGGAAADALQRYGARDGQGFGPAGKSFAIPTKDWNIRTLPTLAIWHYVWRFLEYARDFTAPGVEFQVTAIGTGLAGYAHHLIAGMFDGAPPNCLFDERWRPFLPPSFHFWGTYGSR